MVTPITPGAGEEVALSLADVAGNPSECEAVLTPAILSTGVSPNQSVTGVQQADHVVKIKNGSLGVSTLVITVNGQPFQVNGLKKNKTKTLDIASALVSGTNSVVISSSGTQGGDAAVLFARS